MSEAQTEYLSAAYDYEERFGSFWHQIREVTRVLHPGASCLEIGPGSGFISDYLRKRGMEVETMDINASCKPNHIGSVEDIPLGEASFDCVMAFEVLEHMPFEKFGSGLAEMARVAKSWVVFSVPDVRWFLSLDLRLFSSSKKLQGIASFPRLTNRKLARPRGPEDHYWEIGRPGYPPSKILAEVAKTGLVPIRNFRIPPNPIHHIFIAKVESRAR